MERVIFKNEAGRVFIDLETGTLGVAISQAPGRKPTADLKIAMHTASEMYKCRNLLGSA